MPTVKDMQNRRDVAKLMDLLVNGDNYSSLQAAEALATIGDGTEEPLLALLNGGEAAERWNIAMALARIGEPAVEDLIAIATTGDDAVRNPAVWALAEIGDVRAVEPLKAILRESPSECCGALTAAALLKIGDPAGIAAVEEEIAAEGEAFEGLVMEAYEGT